MLEFRNLEVSYGTKKALSITDRIEIKAGEKLGLIGSNGAGKTTLIRAVLKLVPYRGEVRRKIPVEEIAVHMQQNEYSSLVSVKDVMEAILGCRIKEHEVAQELIRFFEFEECLRKRYKALSGGQKQRLTMILVMCQESPLTIFDEVTSGLDFETRTRLMQLLQKWYCKRNTTLLVVSHYYEELESLVDKLLLLEQGQVVDYGTKEELFQKYCGKRALIFERNPLAQQIAQGYKNLKTAEDRIAVRCDEEEEERKLAEALRQANIDYVRTHRDIELMVTNAKANWEEERK